MKPLLLIAFATVAVFSQPEVRISQRAAADGQQMILGYSGTNLIYTCRAASVQPTSPSISIASATNANPVVFTVTAGHGFNSSSTPQVTISGGTGNWTGANGTYTATIVSSTTFSIAVNSTAYGAVAGTLVYTSRAPLTTNRIWSVQYFAYDGSNNIIWSGWAGGVPSYTNTCSAAPTQYQ